MKSQAAVVRRAGDQWKVVNIELDPPGPGEVVVAWSFAGLCHSDEHFRNGERIPEPLRDQMFPLLGGHEGAGVVAEVGEGVAGLVVGDHVVACFSPLCGICRYCATGRGHLCNANKDFTSRGQLVDGSIKHRIDGLPLYLMAKVGTFAERTVVSARSLLKIDQDVPLDVACLVSCGVTTGWGAAVETAGTRPGDVVVVVGVGGVGASAVQGARIAGASVIISVDPLESRRNMSLELGATHTTAAVAEADPLVADLTYGQGADRVILAAGLVTADLIRDGMAITGKGGVCVVTGMGPLGESLVPLDIGALAVFEKQLRGCLFGSSDPRHAIPMLIGLYQKGLLAIDEMVTHYPLADISSARDDALTGRSLRSVLAMGPPR